MYKSVFHAAVLMTVVSASNDASAIASRDTLERPSGEVGDFVLEQRTVTLDDGRDVEVEAGHLLVPENRETQESAAVSIPYYRLRSTAERPATPIVLLAGGPGSSWIDRFHKEENQREIEFYRSIADVVVFDQRGAGNSLPRMTCDETQHFAFDRPLEPEIVAATIREMAIRCRDHWLDAGVDMLGYTTPQNAADVVDLAAALGYERLTIIGGSYGSHLGLELMRSAPELIERAVFYGVEGPDHTWDDPAARRAVLERIAGSVETSEQFSREFASTGLLATLAEVIERLEKKPVALSVGEGDNQTTVVVDAALIRLLSSYQAGRFSRPNAWPEFVLDLRDGDYSLVGQAAVALRRLRIGDPMKYLMDCASGVSEERTRRIEDAPATALIGNPNLEYDAICDVWPSPDLGPGFRSPVVSDVPAILIQGTWDTSTPIENAREVAATLPNAQLVEVIGGNHGTIYNLYNHWTPMRSRLAAFLRGEPAQFPETVTLPPLSFHERND